MSVSEGPEIRNLDDVQDGVNNDLDHMVHSVGVMFWLYPNLSTFPLQDISSRLVFCMWYGIGIYQDEVTKSTSLVVLVVVERQLLGLGFPLNPTFLIM